jgi:diaminopimelate decarboxylase
MFSPEIIERFKVLPTPFYYYDLELLRKTLEAVIQESAKYGFQIHYAVKANANERILTIINDYGLGADCVSGNEIARVKETGFHSDKILFAGVGKSDAEINLALDHSIFCFNCESVAELEVINELAAMKERIAVVALRINPNVDALTHQYITTGIEENKFGINMWELDEVIEKLQDLNNLKLAGLHFHIGSQITDLTVFKGLCSRINQIHQWFNDRHILIDHLNVGGGFGVDYQEPDRNSIPDFKSYFEIFNDFLEIHPGQKVHFELGRSIIAQCGSLITNVLYIKQGSKTQFAIVDAGMTELIRPALYHAFHKIVNLTSPGKPERYTVVGPVCESADQLGKYIELPETKRNDLLAIRSAGAYGEIMASRYNLRDLPKAYYSNEI